VNRVDPSWFFSQPSFAVVSPVGGTARKSSMARRMDAAAASASCRTTARQPITAECAQDLDENLPPRATAQLSRRAVSSGEFADMLDKPMRRAVPSTFPAGVPERSRMQSASTRVRTPERPSAVLQPLQFREVRAR